MLPFSEDRSGAPWGTEGFFAIGAAFFAVCLRREVDDAGLRPCTAAALLLLTFMSMRTFVPLVLLTVPLAVLPQQKAPTFDGAALYRAHCASCHGRSGRGDGPVGEFLKVPPADLTQIANHAHGAFPSAQVSRIIDGRQLVRAHGDSKMPVWGDAFSQSLTHEDEATVRQKIDALVNYLRSIQERHARAEPRNLPQGRGNSRTVTVSGAAVSTNSGAMPTHQAGARWHDACLLE
jgi:mono/diheme cytochrome c family protein